MLQAETEQELVVRVFAALIRVMEDMLVSLCLAFDQLRVTALPE